MLRSKHSTKCPISQVYRRSSVAHFVSVCSNARLPFGSVVPPSALHYRFVWSATKQPHNPTAKLVAYHPNLCTPSHAALLLTAPFPFVRSAVFPPHDQPTQPTAQKTAPALGSPAVHRAHCQSHFVLLLAGSRCARSGFAISFLFL